MVKVKRILKRKEVEEEVNLRVSNKFNLANGFIVGGPYVVLNFYPNDRWK